MRTQRRHRFNDYLLFSIIMLGMLAACAPYTRYRVLSFIFDGVPHPDATNGYPGPITQPVSEFQQAIAGVPKLPPKVQPPKIVSVHKPVADRQCSQCHDMSTGSLDVIPDDQLCDKCHKEQRIQEGWDHGPINLGTCVPCHKPHDSIHEHLLDQPVPELCLSCHTEMEERHPEYHMVENFNDCVACHDPHRMY